MRDEFKVGEIAIFWSPGDSHHQREVEIIDGLRLRTARYACEKHGYHTLTTEGYRIKIDDTEWSVLPNQLRKKPKQDDSRDVGSWDDVPFFNPTKQEVEV